MKETNNNTHTHTQCQCELGGKWQQVYSRFLARKTSMLTFSGFNREHCGLTTFTSVLKTRSDGELVAQTHRYFLVWFTFWFSGENAWQHISTTEVGPRLLG